MTSRQALLDEFDANIQELERELGAIDEAALASGWTLRRGDTIKAVQPKSSVSVQWG